jgi:hypothetical protein
VVESRIMSQETAINNAALRGLDWLKKQKPASVKDISRALGALSLWSEPAHELIELLQSKRKDGFWETDTPILDTARACSALAGCGINQSRTIRWIIKQQKNNNWGGNEIDTAYALIALGDCSVKNESGCRWLLSNYGEKWEHAGTTSLIITALLKQDRDKYNNFIKARSNWLLSKRQSGGWTHIATSNLAIQALILGGEEDILPSIRWLLEKQDNGNWGNITSTSLSLISLRMYLDKFNSDMGI